MWKAHSGFCQRSQADLGRGHHDEVSGQPGLDQGPDLLETDQANRRGPILHSEQDHALAVRVVAKDDLTEVLVPGQHDIALGLGFRQQIGVGRLLAGLDSAE